MRKHIIAIFGLWGGFLGKFESLGSFKNTFSCVDYDPRPRAKKWLPNKPRFKKNKRVAGTPRNK